MSSRILLVLRRAVPVCLQRPVTGWPLPFIYRKLLIMEFSQVSCLRPAL